MNITLGIILTIAFLGLGKYPSKREAWNACIKWTSNGPRYSLKADAFAKQGFANYQKRVHDNPVLEQEIGHLYEGYYYNRNGELIVHDGSYRECQEEKDTRQVFGLEPEGAEDGKVLEWRPGGGTIRKRFRY